LGELSLYHFVRSEHLKAWELAAEALRQAQQDEDPLLVGLGHWYLGLALFGLGEFAEARAHFDGLLSRYDPEQHHQLLLRERGADAGLSAMAYDACCLWCLGHPQQALVQSQKALELARQFDHAYSLAAVLAYAGCMLHAMRRDAQAVEGAAGELVRLSKEKRFPAWEAAAICFQGAVLTLQDQVEEGMERVRQGMAMDQAMGIQINFPVYLSFLAEAQTNLGQLEEGLAILDEALLLVDETEEHLWEAELHRLRANLLLGLGDEAQAGAVFQRAIEVARRQQARSWELRAATGLARLWMRQGKDEQARELLAPIYGWFTEGFDTPDLVEARELLSGRTSSPSGDRQS
jgi:predicted ATPase